MGPLQRNKDELLQELSSAPASPVSSAVSPTSDKSAGAVIAAVIPAVANLLSNIWTNRRNEELAEQQNEWNLQQWLRENAFNDPRNQIARLAAAGINPALAYANGDLMNEAAASPQMTSAVGRITSPVQIDPLTAAQVANLNAQTAETESRIPVNKQTASHIAEQISTLQDQYSNRAIERLRSNEEFNKLLNENNLFYSTFSSQVASYAAKAKIDSAEASVAFERCSKQMSVLEATYYDLISSAAYKNAQSDVAKQVKANLDETYNQIKTQTGLLNKQKDLIEKYGDSEHVLGMINQTLSATASMTAAAASFVGTIMSKGHSPNITVPNPYYMPSYSIP